MTTLFFTYDISGRCTFSKKLLVCIRQEIPLKQSAVTGFSEAAGVSKYKQSAHRP